MVRLSKKDINVIKNSKCENYVLAAVFRCSISTILYHKRKGIWVKNRRR